MPIHLPPISRRRFLSRSVIAGAGLMFTRPLWGASKSVDKHCWALFSDLHIAADRKHMARGSNMTDNLNAASGEVMSLTKRPAGVLISGDCAFNSGEMEDYATLTSLLRPMREAQMPIHLTLGNHDDRNHFWDALADAKTARRPLVDHHVAIIETPRANWFVLDSLQKKLVTPGLLGEAQLAWLARSLDAHTSKAALVVCHHNLTSVGDPKSALQDTDQLLAVIRPRQQVKAYFFGHTHKWHIQPDESGIQLINLPPVGYVFEAPQPSGWVRADLLPGGARLELRCLDHTHPAHGQVTDLKWRVG